MTNSTARSPLLSATQSPALLVLPGWDDQGRHQYDTLKQDLSKDGWICRRANLPDCDWPADQRSLATREHTLQQASSDYDALMAEARHLSPTALLGFSYGGYMAALLSCMHSIDLLVLRAPALYLDDDWDVPKEELDKREIAQYRRHEHGTQRNRALHCCTLFCGHVLLIQSERDVVVPSEVTESYAEAFNQAASLTRYTIPEADHQLTDPEWQQDYHSVVTNWLRAYGRTSEPGD